MYSIDDDLIRSAIDFMLDDCFEQGGAFKATAIAIGLQPIEAEPGFMKVLQAAALPSGYADRQQFVDQLFDIQFTRI